MSESQSDCIRINELVLLLPLESGAQWPISEGGSPVLQPISISLSIDYAVRKAAESDDITDTLDYAQLVNKLHEFLSPKTFPTLDHVGQSVCEFIIHHIESSSRFSLQVVKIKAPVHCQRIVCSYSSYKEYGQWRAAAVEYVIEGLLCPTIIGIEPQERLDRQDVLVTCKVRNAKEGTPIACPNIRDLAKQIFEVAHNSTYRTLETLASAIAKGALLTVSDVAEVTISASKPRALPLAKSSEIVLTRTWEDFQHPPNLEPHKLPKTITAVPGVTHTAVLALGSNLGDRFRNIELALRLLEVPGKVLQVDSHAMKLDVIDTSFLYETAPMYVTEQPSFINCACVIETNLSPMTLLNLVKEIESIVGRVPSIRNGPRAVDLDIILFDSAIFDTRPADERKDLENLEGHLVVPHPRLAEREFVLRPLNDIVPDYVHPVLQTTISRLFAGLKIPATEAPMQKVLPFPRLPLGEDDEHPLIIERIPHTLTHWTYGTVRPKHSHPSTQSKIMATLNTTPDSFSDGSTHNSLSTAMRYVQESTAAGASIIDVGGYSTRPGAAFVSTEEEINRVAPYVSEIRQNSEVPISVDTFRWEVAEAALRAGANCINDVYAFTGPQFGDEDDDTLNNMKRIARAYSAPVVLMHSRGDAGQNKDYGQYAYAGQAVLEGVRVELGAKVNRIVTGHGAVRRWLIVADPGIGFSKTLEGNLEILRNASQVVSAPFIGPEGEQRRNPLRGYPQLIGASRKSFLGAVLGQGEGGRQTEPAERVWATAAAVSCAVQQGALLVRVHDVPEMADVVRVANAIWV